MNLQNINIKSKEPLEAIAKFIIPLLTTIPEFMCDYLPEILPPGLETLTES